MKFGPKILIITDTYHPLMDGVLKVIEEYIKRSKRKFRLSLLVPDLSNKNIEGIKTFFYRKSSFAKVSIYPLPKFSYNNFTYIKNIVKGHDIIFAHGPSLVGLYLSLKYGKKFKKTNILYIHGIAWDFIKNYVYKGEIIIKFFKNLIIKYYNSWDLLIAPYEEAKIELQQSGVTTKIEIACLGVDTEKFKPVKNIKDQKNKLNLPNKIIIGYVGRICKEKNTLVLLKAFKKLDSNKYFLLIVGSGDENIIKEFKQENNCHITGFVNNVEEYFKAMDIFIMPSLTETTSLATLEAMASGLAVIASKVGYIKSYIHNKKNGMLFYPKDAVLLYEIIEKLGDNNKLREKLAISARTTVRNSFSWEHTVSEINKHIIELYKRH